MVLRSAQVNEEMGLTLKAEGREMELNHFPMMASVSMDHPFSESHWENQTPE